MISSVCLSVVFSRTRFSDAARAAARPDHARELREGSMRPYRMLFAQMLSSSRASSATVLRAAAVALLLLSVPFSVREASAAPSPAAASGAHVYLLRGVLNIFSLGLDDIADKLRAQGIPVTVANFVSWSSLANEAASEYRSGRVKTIILVGHSSGATALPDMVARLTELGTPGQTGDRPRFGVSHQPERSCRQVHQLLHCQWRGHSRREGQPVPGVAGECQRRRTSRASDISPSTRTRSCSRR